MEKRREIKCSYRKLIKTEIHKNKEKNGMNETEEREMRNKIRKKNRKSYIYQGKQQRKKKTRKNNRLDRTKKSRK